MSEEVSKGDGGAEPAGPKASEAMAIVPKAGEAAEAKAVEPKLPTRVFVTGGTGFVGRYVVRELIARGHTVVCLVRDRERFLRRMEGLPADRYGLVTGDLFDAERIAQGLNGAEAAIHLVGIITQKRTRGQTFERIHVEGTRRVVEVCQRAGVKRYVHMSALGTRLDAVSEYHKTKWRAECIVRESGLDWTIFRPSIIHGPDGEFMRLMKTFVRDAWVYALGFIPAPFPVIPCLGDGLSKVQPVHVKDVAHCFVAALRQPETIGQAYCLGGPKAISWREMYRTCQELIPGSKKWKPIVGQPVWVAKLMARTIMKLPILPEAMRFDVGQVQMSQEDSVCEVAPVEKTFGIQLRDFRSELSAYAAQI